MRPRRRQSFYKAASCPFISSVSTEPQRIGVKILLSESQLILHVAQEIQLQMWTRTQSLESHPRTNRTLPEHPCSMWGPEETRCSSTKRNSKTLQKIFNKSKLAMTLGWKRNVSLGQLFATIHDVQLEGFCCSNSCREHSHPRNGHRSEPEGAIRGNTKIGPVLEVKVTTHFVFCVIEIKIGSV